MILFSLPDGTLVIFVITVCIVCTQRYIIFSVNVLQTDKLLLQFQLLFPAIFAYQKHSITSFTVLNVALNMRVFFVTLKVLLKISTS